MYFRLLFKTVEASVEHKLFLRNDLSKLLMSTDRSPCGGCGISGRTNPCSRCAKQMNKYNNWGVCANKDCKNKCPLRFCAPCFAAHKKDMKLCSTPGCKFMTKMGQCRDCNWKASWSPCEACGVPSPKRLCSECFDIPGRCEQCGGRCRPTNSICMHCREATVDAVTSLLDAAMIS